MSLKESVEKLRKSIREVSSELRGTADSVRGTVTDVRPMPVRRFIRRRLGRVLPERPRQ